MYRLKIIKNSFLIILGVVVVCLVLVVGLQQYVKSLMLSQYVETHRQLSTLIVESTTSSEIEKLKQQLNLKLELLPDWLAVIYDVQGKILWQSQGETPGLELKNISQQQLAQSWLKEEQDWVVSQHPIKISSTGQHQITVTLFSSKLNIKEKIEFLGNLIFLTALLVGVLIWSVLNTYSRQIKSDFRQYIRNNHKEFTHDQLTGLPNRLTLLDRIKYGLAQAKRNSTQVALLYIALDQFKQINDSFGHAFGDQVLRAVTARLLSESRDSDTLVRIDGDQFALLMTGVKPEEKIDLVAKRMIQSFIEPIEIGSQRCVITASIGISKDEHIDDGADELIFNAYTAMMTVKQNEGGNSFLFFNPEMNSEHRVQNAVDV